MPDRERMRTRLRTAGGCLTAFLFSAAAWTAAMALFGFFPFGDKTILITDMGSQYVTYHEALYEMLRGGDSLLFTWNTGMGMNFLGIIAYYLSSPFTVLLLLFPRSLLTEGILFILSAKIAFSGLAFSLFLRKAGGIGGAVNTLFSVAYALSAYSVVYGFNLMWIDGVVLLPLVVLGAVHLYRTRRMLPFILALTVLFVANFYIAYMVGAFTLLCFLGLLLVQQVPRREALGHFGRFMACAGLAAGLAAFLLLPSLFALRNGYESVHGLNGGEQHPVARRVHLPLHTGVLHSQRLGRTDVHPFAPLVIPGGIQRTGAQAAIPQAILPKGDAHLNGTGRLFAEIDDSPHQPVVIDVEQLIIAVDPGVFRKVIAAVQQLSLIHI